MRDGVVVLIGGGGGGARVGVPGEMTTVGRRLVVAVVVVVVGRRGMVSEVVLRDPFSSFASFPVAIAASVAPFSCSPG